ncbi:MAG TPA: HlyD family secretion protein [Candidatus Obscuribacterales bacterium]
MKTSTDREETENKRKVRVLEVADTPPTTPDAPPARSKRSNAKKYFAMLGGALVLSGAIGAGWWALAGGRTDTEDAYVDGDITTISSRVAGTVIAVPVHDNQYVKVNQPLVKLDPSDYQAKVDQLNAALDVAQKQTLANQSKIGQSSDSAQGQAMQADAGIASSAANLDHAKAALLAAQAQARQSASHVQQQEAQIGFATNDFNRYKMLVQAGAVTKQQYDQSLESLQVAQAQLREAQEALNQDNRKVLEAEADVKDATAKQLTSKGQYINALAAQKQTTIDQHTYQSSVASIDQAKFDLKQAQLQLDYTNINAPVEGTIGRRSVEVGQRVEVGQALMSIVQPNPWITANFKETQLSKMKVGQPVEIRIDAFPGKVFTGKVDSFSPASGAKFSVLPPDNATGNFTKVVQRIPVKIVFDKDSVGAYASRISPGMSCVTTVILR